MNGNGTSVSYLYDKLGRVVSIEHRGADGKIAESLQYCYDADGRCIRAASLLGEERYAYDKDGQLTSVRYPDSTSEVFAYDAVGNRTSSGGSQSSATVNYTVNNLNQYTTISGGSQSSATAIKYDDDGNMTLLTDVNGTTTYTYDTLNRLVAVKNITKGIDWSCQYDVFGNRVSVTDNGVTTERIYLQGSLPSVAAEYVNGELKERHIVVGAVRIADISSETDANSGTGGSPVRYYHADLIGSTRLVTDGNGTIIDRRAYKAFGETRVGGSQSSATSTVGYVGSLGVETDPTGLLFMRNRYYSPALGRFIQMDPIGLSGEDVNWYRYCVNNPQNCIDVEGLSSALVTWNDVGKDAVLTAFGGLLGKAAILKYGAINGGVLESAVSAEVGFPSMNSDFHENWQNGNYVLAVTDVVKWGLSLNPAWFWVPLAYDAVNLLGQGAAFVVYNWNKYENQRELILRLERMALEQRVDAMPYCIVLVRPDGGSGGDEPGDPDDPDNPGGGGSGGGGESGGTVIMNEEDWRNVVESRSSGTYSLGADITLTDIHSTRTFSGTLNGNGHKLTGGIYTLTSDGSQQYVYPITGEGATFNNVEFGTCLMKTAQSCTFNGCRGVASGKKLETASSFARSAVGCKFYNCTAQVSIDFQENDGVDHDRNSFGSGIAALVGTATGCTFENCSSAGSVAGDKYVGGLVGKAIGSTFTDCSSSCTINGSLLVGGLVGSLEDGTNADPCTVRNCKATGMVSGRGWVGGFAGAIENCKVSNCTATGNVIDDTAITTESSSDDYFGGFVGHVSEGSSGGCVIELCNASGTVTAEGAKDVGGFAGLINGNSEAQSTVRRCCSTGSVTGGNGVGGFSGNAADCTISDCYSTGAVTSQGINMQSNAGGLIGQFTVDGTLSRCYASGKVTVSSTATMSYSGGLMPITISASMLDMYASMGMLDMMISSAMTSSTSCFWNKDSTGQNYSGTGTGLTAVQALNQSSYSGWDFNNVWRMGSGGPELRNVGATMAAANVKAAAKLKANVGDNAKAVSGLQKNVMKKVTADPITAVGHRLYCYERYVVAKGSAYAFELSTGDGAAISVSGLPSGFFYSNGEIYGYASAIGETTVTITTRNSTGTTTRYVPFVVVETPGDFAPFVLSLVCFDTEGGNSDTGFKIVPDGTTIGDIPVPTRTGYVFDGWYTAADGGSRVSADTVVTRNVTYYAHWTPNGGGSGNGGSGGGRGSGNGGSGGGRGSGNGGSGGRDGTVTPQPRDPSEYILYDAVGGVVPAVATVYDGYLYLNGSPAGTIQVKVGKPNTRTGLAAVRATLVGTDGKRKTLKAAEKGKVKINGDGPTTVSLVGGDTCTVTLGAKGMSGMYGSYEIDGGLNVFTSKDAADKAVATATLANWQGAVNVAWCSDVTGRVPPYNTLSMTIAAKGKAKVTGTLADGAKVRAKGQLIVGEEWCCVPVMYAKNGASLRFAVWSPRAATSAAPVVVGIADTIVGKPGTLKGGAAFRIDAAAFGAVLGKTVLPYLPDGVPVTGGAKWTLPKAGKVVYAKGTTTVDAAKAGENPSGLKLTYKAKDGTFKGSFKVYVDVNGKPRATTVKVAGVVVDGVGYGTATVNKSGGVSVKVE